MTQKGILAAALILALSGASWKSATAAPITYTISFTASGTLDSKPFHNEPVQIVASTDTERVIATRKNKHLVATTATFGYGDNPIQIPIGTPIALALIAAALLFFPTIIGSGGATMLGGGGERLRVSSPGFASYQLWQPTQTIAATVKLPSPLTLTLVRNHRPVKLSINSIRGNQVGFRAEVSGAVP